MKKWITPALIGLLFCFHSIIAVPEAEFTRVQPPNADQKRVMDTLFAEIISIQKTINEYYQDLPEYDPEESFDENCQLFYGGQKIFCHFYARDIKNNITFVPLLGEQEVHYGQRERHIYNEIAMIKWTGEKAAEFHFTQRRGNLSTSAVLLKKLWGNSIADLDPNANGDANPPVNFVVNEILSQGQGAFVNFRFPQEEVVRDSIQPIDPDNPDGQQMEIIFLRDPAERIRIMREYVRLLRRLEFRLNWHMRSQNFRRMSEIQRVLRAGTER
ncbi:MAG: hypothetical protein KDK34_15730 [Leptospiraceae bacterium]|nr:hypothetical protein [Leptospiraceae bacterium]MCB1321706.1 hypothetical protein [Leptospiraceae bacterium]